MSVLNIAVIGGGPAGLMAAITHARNGCNVTVFEKNSWPIDKVCGEGIMPRGVSFLERYGILNEISAEDIRPFYGIEYINPMGKRAEADFASGKGYVIRRTALSKALFKTASHNSKITLISGTSLIDFTQDPDGVEIKTSPAKPSLQKFDYLIASDGLRSKVRKVAGLVGRRTTSLERAAGRVHYQLKPWSDKVQVWWQDGIEAYVAPSADDCIDFIFGWDVKRFKPKSSGLASLEKELFAKFPELQTKISGAKRLSNFECIGGMARSASSFSKERVFLIGDAAIFCDPITGEGLSLAFEQAHLLAQSIGQLHLASKREELEQKLNSLSRNYLKVTRAALLLSRYKTLRNITIDLFHSFPGLFQHMLEVNMGNRRFL